MNNGHDWKVMRTYNSGYVLIDPLIEVGKQAVLDGEYATGGSIVYLRSIGTVFATVSASPNGEFWSVMLNRLNHVPKGYKPNPDRPKSALDSR